MEPVSYILASGLGNSIGGVFGGVAELMNGKWARDLQKRLHAEDRADAAVRFGKDFDLRSRQFAWTQREAEAAVARHVKERMEDFLRQDTKDKQGRSFDRLRTVFNGSPDGFWLHDPYANANPGVKSLRILVQTSDNTPRMFHQDVERDLNASLQEYEKKGDGHPIHFPTGVWAKGAQSGSWVASELHAWDPSIPTLILRIEHSTDGRAFLQADVFGFPMGDVDFKQAVELGCLPSNTEDAAKVLSLAAMAASDMYYLSNYGRTPLLPYLLKEFAPAEDQKSPASAAIQNLVTGYQNSINQILADTPEAAIYVAVQLAEALAEFSDKSYGLKQAKEVEIITQSILHQHPQIAERLLGLYTKLGSQDGVSRLQKLIDDNKKADLHRPNLDQHL